MSALQLALHIVGELRRHGHQALLAGGCVRDMLLGQEPKDFDVATDALAEQIQRYFPDSRPVGAQFGVVLVRGNEAEVEVATFRLDHDYRDGRRPASVTFTRSPEQDVRRRDFTINGLLYDPAENQYLDYVGGQRDLEARLIRAIGDPAERFREDKLRMLRAVRFAARLGFEIEPETMKAIQARPHEILQIAPERIRDEIRLILTEGGAKRGFELLDESGLLEALLPEVAAMKGVPQPPEFHPEGDVWTHTLLMLEQMEKPSFTLALGVLLHDVGKPVTYEVRDRIRFSGHVEAGVQITEDICKRLRISNHETEQVLALVAHHMRFKDVKRMRPSKLKKFLRMSGFDEHLELHRLDCLGSHRNLANHGFLREKLAELPEEQLRPKPLVTGHDLIQAGYEPGPAFSSILTDVEDLQLEGKLATKEEALEYVRTHYALSQGETRPEARPRGSRNGGQRD